MTVISTAHSTIKNAFFIAIICMFTIHSNSIAADPTCTVTTGSSRKTGTGYYACEANSSALSCQTSCTSASCTIATISGSQMTTVTFGFCSCNSCQPGYYRTPTPGSVWNGTPQQYCGSQPTFYTCTPCSCGTYGGGETATSCTAKCPQGTYGGGGADVSSCNECPKNATCAGTGLCTFTCNAGFEPYGDQCLKTCPQHATRNNAGDCICNNDYYRDSDECKSCPENATCTGGTDFKCNDGYIKDNGKCIEDPENKCPDGTPKTNGICTCGTGQYYYPDTNVCKDCPKNTVSCTSATDFTCIDGYTKQNDECVENQPECPDNSTIGTDDKCVCNAGYYGDPTTKCKSCPNNATCAGGENFECDDGYTKDGDTCVKNKPECPEHSTPGTDGNCVCNTDYYKDNSQCTKCPTRDDVFTDEAKTIGAQYTSVAGATSKTNCYLESGTYYNKKGTFTLSNQCNWKEKN
ncbi:MAG: hypothetical protein ACLRFJ_02605 [Alphaproteobacteria bacterium]